MLDVIDPDVSDIKNVNQNKSASDSTSIMDALMPKYEQYLNVMPDRIQIFEEQKEAMIVPVVVLFSLSTDY